MLQSFRPLFYSISKSILQPTTSKYTFAPLARHKPTGAFQHTYMSSGANGSPNAKPQKDNLVSITFVKPDGRRSTVKSEPGKSLYDVVIDNNLDLDGFGSCEGTLCCTTCHLIFNEKDYKKLEEFSKPQEEELNMLDLAEGLCDTSRLGCQVVLPEGIDSIEVQIPPSMCDIRV